MTEEIKDCPFCGGPAVLGKIQDDYNCSRVIEYDYIVYCLDDDCVASAFSLAACYDKPEEAIEEWNKRV